MDKIKFDDDNYLYIDGIKVCQVKPGDEIEFFDRSEKRSKQRGSPVVRIPVLDFVRAIASRQKAVV